MMREVETELKHKGKQGREKKLGNKEKEWRKQMWKPEGRQKYGSTEEFSLRSIDRKKSREGTGARHTQIITPLAHTHTHTHTHTWPSRDN
jgi:hypothetical protein